MTSVMETTGHNPDVVRRAELAMPPSVKASEFAIVLAGDFSDTSVGGADAINPGLGSLDNSSGPIALRCN